MIYFGYQTVTFKKQENLISCKRKFYLKKLNISLVVHTQGKETAFPNNYSYKYFMKRLYVHYLNRVVVTDNLLYYATFQAHSGNSIIFLLPEKALLVSYYINSSHIWTERRLRTELRHNSDCNVYFL